MSVLYSLIDTLLPFEWTEFAYMKNAFLAVLLITPLFGLVGTMVVNNKMSFFPMRSAIRPSPESPSAFCSAWTIICFRCWGSRSCLPCAYRR